MRLLWKHTSSNIVVLVITLTIVTGSLGFSWISEFDYDDSSNGILNESVDPLLDNSKSDYGERLFLTPIISNEKSSEVIWKELALVRNFTEVMSYSGFFTVNKEYNSNLFFWFFPAAYNPESAPLVVWLNGGPGTSSLFGLFVENGPFEINNEGFMKYRSNPWTLTHSIIYIDSPVGTGFSFTNDTNGYAKSQDDVSRDLYEALTQFFRVFPEYQSRDFYVAGESYAGKYVPNLAYKIHVENKRAGRKVKMNMKGIMIGSGFSDPATQNEYGEYLYNLGLIDDRQRDHFEREEARIRSLIKNQDWKEATDAVQGLVLGYPDRPSFFQNLTSYRFYMNIMETKVPQSYKNYVSYLAKDYVRRSIHVGDQPFVRGSVTVLNYLITDICKSVKPQIEKLLTEDYRVLMYAPQLDIIVPHTGIDKFIRSLRWGGASQYARADRKIWNVNGEIAGYTKSSGNFVHLFMRKSGHVSSLDQPLWSFDMVNRFTRGIPFD